MINDPIELLTIALNNFNYNPIFKIKSIYNDGEYLNQDKDIKIYKNI